MDHVHTLTSLTGFEALLRERPVHHLGHAVLRGLGADRTTASVPTTPARQRRKRRLRLDELVAATLILYPTYLSRRSGAYTTPEQALLELREWQRLGTQDGSTAAHAWRAFKRRVLHALAHWRQR